MDAAPAPSDSTAVDPGTPRPVRIGVIVRGVLLLATLVGAALTYIYHTQPDSLTALTAIPAWCWALPALVLLLETRDVRRCRAWRACTVVTVMYLGLCVEQTRSLPRGWFTSPPATGDNSWRVVSLNCHVGTAAVVDDLLPLQPDVVLLQESPSEATLAEMTQRLFGAEGTFVSTGDCSLLARGPLAAIPASRGARFVMARWQPASGPPVVVASLRLTPPPTRLDYWRPSCWAAHRGRRNAHRRQLAELAAAIGEVPRETPLIIGGDFNSPAGDAAYTALRPRLQDAFNTAGRGWGATFSRDFAFHRIDQIWLSPQCRALDVQAHVARNSDHRAVVCDVAAAVASEPRP